MVDLRPTADFSSIIKQAEKAVIEILNLNKATISLAQSSVRLEKDSKGLTKALVDVNFKLKDGSTILGKYDEFTKKTIVSVKNLTVAEQKRAEASLKAQKAAELALNQRSQNKFKYAAEGLKSTSFINSQIAIPSGATQAGVVSLRSQIKSLNDLVIKHRVMASTVNQIWGELSKGEVKQYLGSQQLVQKQIQNIINTQQKLVPVVKETAQQSQKVFLSMSSLVRLASIQVLHRFFSTLTSSIEQAVTEAANLQVRIAEIQTIDTSRVPFGTWQKELRALSNEFGTSFADQAEAAYQALSNQVVDGANAYKFLRDANELATIAVSSNTDAVNLLSSVLNSYQMSADKAREVSAQLFKTVELGRLRISDIANDFGEVSVMANQLGAPLNELLGLIAALTKQGLPVNKVFTQIRGILAKAIQPTEEMKELFKKLNVETGEAAYKTYGLVGFIDELIKVTGGSSTEIAKYINRLRGLSGALAATGAAHNDFIESTKLISDSLETYNEKVQLILDNEGKQIQILKEQIKNFIVQDIGNAFVSGINKLIQLNKKLEISSEGPDFTKIKNNLKTLTNEYTSELQKQTRLVEENAKKQEKATLNSVAATRGSLTSQADFLEKSLEGVYDNLSDRLSDYISDLNNTQNRLQTSLMDSRKTIYSIISDAREKLFKEDLARYKPEKQLKIVEDRLKKARQRAKNISFFGDEEEFKLANEEIKQLFNLREDLLKNEESLNKKNVDLRKDYVKLVKEEIANRQQLALSEFKAQSRLKALEISYSESLRKLKSFNIESVLRIDDEKERTQIYQDQISNIKELIALQKKNNIEGVNELDLKRKILYFEQLIGNEYLKTHLRDVEKSTSLGGITFDKDALKKTQDQLSVLEGAQEQAKNIALEILQGNDIKDLITIAKSARNNEGSALRATEFLTELKDFNKILTNKTDRNLFVANLEEFTKGLPDIKTFSSTQQALISDLIDLKNRLNTTGTPLSEAILNTNKSIQAQLDMQNKLNDAKKFEAEYTKKVVDENLKQTQLDLASLEATKKKNEELAKQLRLQSILNNFKSSIFNINTVLKPIRQATGSTGRGTDTVPALLSPGEFIINSKSTSKFYSQLLSMNNPGIQRFSDGGTVQNNYGGFNMPITVQSTDGVINPEALGRQLNKLVRQGRFAFRGK